ncbi:MAG: GxxExxY protein [Candidatus Magasanikbacteria bacterium CG11_big_fil_rev_8_21_14_0_20_43_7]|uniref:GxxExxY protein n=1 Tax=Candidatus Magasanikbacteria bacterium CG11_big_fil_rev_8_21_14_0_20_43_7 TaxID=1974654 RepID=A0A2H0N251_9BACT|nr:MAG: GxxExxY protein [Candidatus Magasanikbacteria bacterium CG11_big_fil_rev_8_21_14_0_20_43_7]
MLKEEHTTKLILEAYYNVYNRLGYGFLEKVYENALILELGRLGLHGLRQVKIDVYDLEKKVGEYFADVIVDDRVIIEIKAAEGIREEHEAQLLNYLRATHIEVGLLLNFGKKPQFKRQVFENQYKKSVPTR